MSLLNGKVAWVTGGGQGIGAACARHLAAQGARVAVSGRRQGPLDEVVADLISAGREAVAIQCDVSDPALVDSAAAQVVSLLGPVDILVANAGISGSSPLARTSDALWNSILGVNLNGTFYCVRAVLPSMLSRGQGRIIAISSDAGKTGFPYTSAYCASKHGVVGLVRSLALEVARKGITVNAVCPGFVETDMAEAAIANIAGSTRRTPEEARAYLEGLNPQGRMVTADEVAALTAFLATDLAQGINGQAIPLDGGAVMS